MPRQIQMERLEESSDFLACCQQAEEADACIERMHFLPGVYEQMDAYQLDVRQCVLNRR